MTVTADLGVPVASPGREEARVPMRVAAGSTGGTHEAVDQPLLRATRFDPQEQLSIAQVARLLQCSERWLYGKVREGELRATHLGRAVRISRFHLQRFLDSRDPWRPPTART
jgi:excisionase family DNA binding protein